MKENKKYRIQERINSYFHISDAKYVTQKFYDVEMFDYIMFDKYEEDFRNPFQIIFFVIEIGFYFLIKNIFNVKLKKEWIVLYTYTDKKKAQRYLNFLKENDKNGV